MLAVFDGSFAANYETNLALVPPTWKLAGSFGEDLLAAPAAFGWIEGTSDISVGDRARLGFPRSTALPVDHSLWALDATAAESGPLLCTTQASGSTLTLHGDEWRLDLAHVSTLRCPGTPVVGSIETCVASNCGAVQELSGTIDGTPWRSPVYATSHVLVADDGSYVRYTPLAPSNDMDLAWALIVGGARSPFPGAVLCVGSGTVRSNGSLLLQDLSRLDCSATATGTLTGCVR
jgi:hypothetical protein